MAVTSRLRVFITGLLAVAAVAATAFVGSKTLGRIYPEEMMNGDSRKKDAVLVFGSTGKTGRAIVRQVLILCPKSQTQAILCDLTFAMKVE